MLRQLSVVLLIIIALLTPRVSQANSDSVSIPVTITLVSSGGFDEVRGENGELITISWSTTGNPNDYVGQFTIVVRVGEDWNYDEYTYSLKEPNYVYHAETFDPNNFLNEVDPYGEAAYASLSHAKHYTDIFHFADPEEVMVANDSGAGLIDESMIKNTLIRSIM